MAKPRRKATLRSKPTDGSVSAAAGSTIAGPTVVMLPVDQVQPNKSQPRKDFGDIDGLAETMKDGGILEPLLVVHGSNGFVIQAGERRWRAAQKAGLDRVPCIVRDGVLDPVATLLENMARKDLDHLETAHGIADALETGISKSELGKRLGIGSSGVSKALAMLKLPDAVARKAVAGGWGRESMVALAGLGDAKLIRETFRDLGGGKDAPPNTATVRNVVGNVERAANDAHVRHLKGEKKPKRGRPRKVEPADADFLARKSEPAEAPQPSPAQIALIDAAELSGSLQDALDALSRAAGGTMLEDLDASSRRELAKLAKQLAGKLEDLATKAAKPKSKKRGARK